MSTRVASPLNLRAIDAKLYLLHGHVRDWVEGIRCEGQPNPLECIVLQDELLELRFRTTEAAKQ